MLEKKPFDYDRCVLYTTKFIILMTMKRVHYIIHLYVLYTTKFIILMTEKGALYYTPMCIIHKLIQ